MNRPENPQTAFPIPDVQSRPDARRTAIDQVGIRGLRYPLLFADSDGVARPTIASYNVYVALAADRKGTHMSRLVALLEARGEAGQPPLSVVNFHQLLDTLVVLLDAPGGRVEIAFPFFVRKSAPVSGVESLLDYEVRIVGELGRRPLPADRVGRGAGDLALPLLEGGRRVRRAQPALDDHDHGALAPDRCS